MISLNDIFVQFKQICGGRFLLGLRELLNLERILQYRSFIKENINLLKKDPTPEIKSVSPCLRIYLILKDHGLQKPFYMKTGHKLPLQ